MKKRILVAGLAVLALVVVSGVAHATGVMFVKNDRVGIGTANPTVPLHIDAPGGDDFAGMGPEPSAADGQGFNFGYAASVSGGFFNTRTGGFTNMNLATSNVVRLLIDGGNGRIIFGTSVLGQVPAHPLVHFDSGAHLTAGGVWQDVSTRAAKQNIEALSAEEAMQAFRSLNPMTYQYKAEPGETYVGFIAEDVPDLVATADRKSMTSMDVVAVLTKVVQEQQSAIEQLQRRLAALEDR